MNLQTFRRSFNPRHEFDPSKKEDLLELKFFKDNGKWKNGCPFYVEDPFIEVPAMCYYKYTEYMLSMLKVTTRKQKSPK
jgi:hypothetical protein